MNPTPAPLHDIVGPVAIPGLPVTAVAGAAAATLLLGLLALWFFRRKFAGPRLSPRQRALAALEALAGSPTPPYEFGVRASDILRSYVRDQHGIDATTRTSLEFLQVLRDNSVFDENEKASLAAFLEAADLLKFARAEAGREEMSGLLATAKRLVLGRGEARA